MKISHVTNYQALFAFIRWIKFLLEFHFARVASSVESLFAHITRIHTRVHTDARAYMREYVRTEREGGRERGREVKKNEWRKRNAVGSEFLGEHYYHWK